MSTIQASKYIWDLQDLFLGVDDPNIELTLENVLIQARQFESSHKGRCLDYSPAELCHVLQEYELLKQDLYKVSQFASLSLSIDTQDSVVKALVARVGDVSSEVSNLVVFLNLELSQLSDDQCRDLLQAPELKNYVYYIKRQKDNAVYKLSENEEKMVTLKDLTGFSGYKKMYQELTASFTFEFELDGNVQTLNGTQLRNLRLHKDATVRRNAMKLFYSRYQENTIVLTHIFNNIYKDFNVERQYRGYKSAINVRNISNDLSDKAIKSLHEVTTESNYLVQRYYRLKSKIINLPDLSLTDIYAPMPTTQKEFDYNEAKDIVLRGFSAFDQEFYQFSKLMFDENRIHAPVLPKKQGGAYCSGYTPDVKPFVMLNFLGKPRDVSTMAHELGHAIHDMYASKQSLINYHPILPLAETASVFSEMLITDLLLNEVSDQQTKQSLLTEKIEDIFATSHRQNMFSCFEMAAHARVMESLPSVETYCELYHTQLKTMFGEAVHIPEEYRWEWSTIPHFINYPFYVYAYNFGNLLVMALYQQYKEEGHSFIPKLKQVLSAGSSMDPIAITSLVGVDIESKAFWKKSIVYIETLIDELESIL